MYFLMDLLLYLLCSMHLFIMQFAYHIMHRFKEGEAIDILRSVIQNAAGPLRRIIACCEYNNLPQ